MGRRTPRRAQGRSGDSRRRPLPWAWPAPTPDCGPEGHRPGQHPLPQEGGDGGGSGASWPEEGEPLGLPLWLQENPSVPAGHMQVATWTCTTPTTCELSPTAGPRGPQAEGEEVPSRAHVAPPQVSMRTRDTPNRNPRLCGFKQDFNSKANPEPRARRTQAGGAAPSSRLRRLLRRLHTSPRPASKRPSKPPTPAVGPPTARSLLGQVADG